MTRWGTGNVISVGFEYRIAFGLNSNISRRQPGTTESSTGFSRLSVFLVAIRFVVFTFTVNEAGSELFRRPSTGARCSKQLHWPWFEFGFPRRSFPSWRTFQPISTLKRSPFPAYWEVSKTIPSCNWNGTKGIFRINGGSVLSRLGQFSVTTTRCAANRLWGSDVRRVCSKTTRPKGLVRCPPPVVITFYLPFASYFTNIVCSLYSPNSHDYRGHRWD